MKESSTYQALLEEGRMEGAIAEARRLVRLLGEDAFGPPDPEIAKAIENLADLPQLEELIDRTLHCGSWQEVFDRPASLRRRRRRRRPGTPS